MAICCANEEQAEMIWQPLLEFVTQHGRALPVDWMLDLAAQSPEIQHVATLLRTEVPYFFAVVLGHRCGIYFSR